LKINHLATLLLSGGKTWTKNKMNQNGADVRMQNKNFYIRAGRVKVFDTKKLASI
jgi:hypothetical protein